MRKTALALLLCAAATGALAQEPKPAAPAAAPAAAAPAAPVADPAMSGLRPVWSRVKDILVRAAEKMPEENYAFQPTPEVRSFGQLAAHVADSNYFFGSVVLGEKPPVTDVEKTKTSKADIVAALKGSVEYLDRAFAMSDADAAKTVKFFGKDSPKFSVFGLVIGHGFEHYGNMVTYMRMKGLVPPSSEPRPAEKK
ncbi:MAG: DinB family protein [Thermoanaerobaculia bacterium]